MQIKFIVNNNEIIGENFINASFMTRINRSDAKLVISNLFLCEMSINSKTMELYDFIINNAEGKFEIQAIDDNDRIVCKLTNGEIRFLESNVIRGSYRIEIEKTS